MTLNQQHAPKTTAWLSVALTLLTLILSNFAVFRRWQKTFLQQDRTVVQNDAALVLYGALKGATPDPMAAQYRPPLQTASQAKGLHKVLRSSREQSEAAKEHVKMLLVANRSVYKDTLLQNKSAEELLEIFAWEFQHLPVQHGGPATSDDDWVGDDDLLSCALMGGFLKNPCQRWVHRSGWAPHCYLCQWMQSTFKTPETMRFEIHRRRRRRYNPTLVEANDCTIFLANNWGKTTCGNLQYGSVNYVFNVRRFHHLLAWVPKDTGYGPPESFGSYYDFWHLLEPNSNFLNYDLPHLLKRWTIPGTPPVNFVHSLKGPTAQPVPYMEVELYASFRLPDVISYITVLYSSKDHPSAVALWGTDLGVELREYLKHYRRPLLWTTCNDDYMLIDPIVGVVQTQSIQHSDIDYFTKHWKNPKLKSWKDLLSETPKYLWFRHASYFERHKCAELEQDESNIILGLDGYGNCVFWSMMTSNTKAFECLNDGTCAEVDPSTARTSYPTLEECQEHCKPWICVRDKVLGKVKTQNETVYQTAYCIPGKVGDHETRESCESACIEIEN
jgi:hypothetical protein